MSLYSPSADEFEALLNEHPGGSPSPEGSVVRGKIIDLTRDRAIIDVGLKTEGSVDLKEFSINGNPAEIKIGDYVDVYVERIENAKGEAVLSREKARREEAWLVLERAFAAGDKVEGYVFSRVKGGFTVDLGGAVAFLPGSQVDVRPLRDPNEIMNGPQRFVILKMDHRRGNIVVSRRAVLEEVRAEQRAEIVGTLVEGAIIDGVVKNITDYGAFVDLGGVDGLLHVTDISWKRIAHPSEVLSVGQNVRVQLVKVSIENQRISLGMKQLEVDPWVASAELLSAGTRVTGTVLNMADYGVFVEIAPGVEGLVHVSEMSWVQKNVHPDKIVAIGSTIDVQVLEVDTQKRRISLGMKQCTPNPWRLFLDAHPVGSVHDFTIRSVTESGLFLALTDTLDGTLNVAEIEGGEEALKTFEVGASVKAKVIEGDAEREKVILSLKQVTDAKPVPRKNDVLKVTLAAHTDAGLDVSTPFGAGVIRKADVVGEPEVGAVFDAKVTSVEKDGTIVLSMKALLPAEAKAPVEETSGTLGDLLGAALRGA